MLQLSDCDDVMLCGDFGDGVVCVMWIVVCIVQVMFVLYLIDIMFVYIDGCLYYGQMSFDFVDYFVDMGVKVVVLIILNVGLFDLIYFELYYGDCMIQCDVQCLMDVYL